MVALGTGRFSHQGFSLCNGNEDHVDLCAGVGKILLITKGQYLTLIPVMLH